MVEIACPHCGKRLSLREEQLGRNGRCPGCKQVIPLAAPAPVAAVAPAAPVKPAVAMPPMASPVQKASPPLAQPIATAIAKPVARPVAQPVAAQAPARPVARPAPRPAQPEPDESESSEPGGFSFKDMRSPNVVEHSVDPETRAAVKDMSDDERSRWGLPRIGLVLIAVSWLLISIVAGVAFLVVLVGFLVAFNDPTLLMRDDFGPILGLLLIAAAGLAVIGFLCYLVGLTFCLAAPLMSVRFPAGIALLMIVGWTAGAAAIAYFVAQDTMAQYVFGQRAIYIVPGWLFLWAVQLHVGARIPGAVAGRFRDRSTAGSFFAFAWIMPIIYLLTVLGGMYLHTIQTHPPSLELVFGRSALESGGFLFMGLRYLSLNRHLRRTLSASSRRR